MNIRSKFLPTNKMSHDLQAEEGNGTAAHSDDQQTKRGAAWHVRAQATKQTGEQTRILRSRLLGRMVLLLLAWSACFSLLCVFFEFSLSDSIGERVADATSTWIYSSLPTERSLLDAEKNSTVETNDNEDTRRSPGTLGLPSGSPMKSSWRAMMISPLRSAQRTFS